MKSINRNKLSVPRVVLLGVGDANGVGVVRSLGRNGVPVLGIETNLMSLGMVSRYCRGLVAPDPKKYPEDKFVDFLIRLGQQQKTKSVLFPAREDLEIIALRNRDKLEKYYDFALAKLEIVEKIMDKEKFCHSLENLDIPYPQTYFCGSEKEIEEISKTIAYPCIIKPTTSMEFGKEFGVKVFKANSPEQLIDSYRKTQKRGYRIIIQEIIPGDDTELYSFFGYFDRNSKLLAAFTLVKIRQYPPGFGVTALGKNADAPQIIELCTKYLQSIGYHGLMDAEFKKDSRDGKFKFIEVNARLGIQNGLALRCGVNLPLVAYNDMIGGEIPHSNSCAREVKWFSMVADVRSSLPRIIKGEFSIFAWIRSLKGEKVYSVFTWDDPLPFVLQQLNILFSLPRVLLRPLRLRVKSKSGSIPVNKD